MPHIITQTCIGTKDTSCVDVCPVDCIHPRKDEAEFAKAEMLYIDPETCIDCEACVPACPINAIWPDHELPDAYASWKAYNAQHAKQGKNVTEGSDPLPTAKLLEEIQAEEKAKGLAITEPSKAS